MLPKVQKENTMFRNHLLIAVTIACSLMFNATGASAQFCINCIDVGDIGGDLEQAPLYPDDPAISLEDDLLFLEDLSSAVTVVNCSVVSWNARGNFTCGDYTGEIKGVLGGNNVRGGHSFHMISEELASWNRAAKTYAFEGSIAPHPQASSSINTTILAGTYTVYTHAGCYWKFSYRNGWSSICVPDSQVGPVPFSGDSLPAWVLRLG